MGHCRKTQGELLGHTSSREHTGDGWMAGLFGDYSALLLLLMLSGRLHLHMTLQRLVDAVAGTTSHYQNYPQL